MRGDRFVGREEELRQLQGFLEKAGAGEGNCCFVAGEAGAGKSALVNEFVRRAQEADRSVVAAVGQCNAQTGMGDAYLPFREILTVLSGAQDEKQKANTVNATNAARLKEFVRISSETLLELGPDLIGLFVPGASLLAKLATTAANKGKLADKLAQQVGNENAQAMNAATLSTNLDQEKIFAQYATVLSVLAQKHTLILILDDLHWADSASVNLLFHLARQLQQSRVLIIGTYRPNDVALGRDGDRHPVEPLVNELKRYHGEIVIELGDRLAGEGRAFVDALVDAEPNQLDTHFRQRLFERTEGLPLFAVELLRNLQERGDLVQDTRGRWVEGATLDWSNIPARVEGVIQERLARVAEDLRETLTVGSVIGYSFFAQVIARVQSVPERELLKKLGRELDKRHHLVHEQGESKVGSQFLSQYRFAHVLFQQFLYNELSAGERRLLHGEVANALETLYAGHTDEAAVQLARHYTEAGDEAKAVGYVIEAGDASRRAFAYPEARLHYRNALSMMSLLGESVDLLRARIDMTIKYVDIAFNSDVVPQLVTRLQEAEALFSGLPQPAELADRARRAYLHAWLGYLHEFLNDTQAALGYVQPLLEETKAIGNEPLYTEVAGLLGWMYSSRGRFAQALPLLVPSVTFLETRNSWLKTVQYTTGLSFALAGVGRCAEGIALAQQFVDRGREAKHDLTIATGQGYLALITMMMEDDGLAFEAAQACINAAERGGELSYVIHGHMIRAYARSRQGDHVGAKLDIAHAHTLTTQIGSQWHQKHLLSIGAEIALNGGDYADALAKCQNALVILLEADNLWMQGRVHRTWAKTLASSGAAWAEVEPHLTASLEVFRVGDARVETAHTQVVWGELLAARGDQGAAHAYFTQAATQYEQAGLTQALARVRALLV